jgi:TolB-like protein/DNA-binding winged helix-turn-helix (wHTH) protein
MPNMSCDKIPAFSSESEISTTPSPPRVIRFGVFEVDLAAGEVRKAGLRQKLAGQPFRVLQVLLESPSQVVTREDLRRRLWPDNTFVDYELALKKAVNRIREMLGDSADSPHFIETIPRRGYRFIGAISPPSLPAESREPPQSAVTDALGQPLVLATPRHAWKLLAALSLIPLAALLLWWNAGKLRTRIFARSRGLEIHSIAVLPLQNLSKDPDQEYFSDGMTEALTTDLAQIGALRVISRTSAEHFKNSRETLPEIGRQLNVDAIVEGSVTRSENRVRVTAQLIDAQSDHHLWAKSYERDLKDVLSLQDEVARDIAAEVRISLTPQEQSRLSAEKTISPRAYDAYLRGRYLWGQRNVEGITKARGYFEQAVREDPNFALAYSGLSDTYWVGWGAKIDLPLSDQYALKAISLAPDLAEGHASLGIVRLSEYRTAEAEQELKRALELNPNYVMAHHWYSGYLLGVGQREQALAENDLAKHLDPFSVPVNTSRMIILVSLRQYDQAIDQAERIMEIAPQLAHSHDWAARVYWFEGKAREAIAEEKKAAALEHFAERLRSMDDVSATYRKCGLRAAQVEAAQFMERSYLAKRGGYEATFIAFQYANARDTAKAFQWLQEAERTHEMNLYLALENAPEFDFLRSDPRFRALLRRLNLPT